MYELQNHIYFNISPNSDMKTFYAVCGDNSYRCGYDSYLYELPPFGSYPHHTFHYIHIIYKE